MMEGKVIKELLVNEGEAGFSCKKVKQVQILGTV